MKKIIAYKHTFCKDIFWFCFSKKQAKKRAIKKLRKEMPDLPFPIRGLRIADEKPYRANTYEDFIEKIF